MMLEIRQLDLRQEHDFQTLARCTARLYRELVDDEDAALFEAQLGRIRRQLIENSPQHWAFVATQGGDSPLAFFTLAESFALFAHGRYGILNELWVDSAKRSLGIGAQVIHHCRAFGKGRGWLRIDVSAPPDSRWDRSLQFYRSCGFVLTGRKLKIFIDEG